MPTDYELDPALHVVRSRAYGVLTEAESLQHYERLKHDPDFDPTYVQLCDLTDVTELQASTPFLQELARLGVFAPGTRRAFVAPRASHYGLARMLQTFAEIEGTEIGVFHSMEEAEAWLALPSGPKEP